MSSSKICFVGSMNEHSLFDFTVLISLLRNCEKAIIEKTLPGKPLDMWPIARSPRIMCSFTNIGSPESVSHSDSTIHLTGNWQTLHKSNRPLEKGKLSTVVHDLKYLTNILPYPNVWCCRVAVELLHAFCRVVFLQFHSSKPKLSHVINGAVVSCPAGLEQTPIYMTSPRS